MAETLGCPANQDHGNETTWEMLGRAASLQASWYYDNSPQLDSQNNFGFPQQGFSKGLAFRKICFAGSYSKLSLLWQGLAGVVLYGEVKATVMSSLQTSRWWKVRSLLAGMQVPLHRSQCDFPAESRTSPPLDSSPGQGKGLTTTGEC